MNDPRPISYLQRFGKTPGFPTPEHQRACESVVDYLSSDERISAVLLTCSCARGMASPRSCVDMTVLVTPADYTAYRDQDWPRVGEFIAQDPACQALQAIVPFDGIDIDLSSGEFTPSYHGHTTGPDWYEVEIGNTVAWVHPLLQRGDYFASLECQYLPYYEDTLARERQHMVLAYAENNLDHVLPTARRGLLIQAHKRLTNAMYELLQALFIERRIYPITYDKWVREQLVDILQEPAMYDLVLHTLALPALDVSVFEDRVLRLRQALRQISSHPERDQHRSHD